MLLPRTVADLIADFWADVIALIFEVVISHLFGRYWANVVSCCQTSEILPPQI